MSGKVFFKKVFLLCLFIASMLVIRDVFSRITKLKTIKSEKAFFKNIRNPRYRGYMRSERYKLTYNLAVVLFYKRDKGLKKRDRELYNRINQLEDMFKRASRIFKYEDSGVNFIIVNVERRRNLGLDSFEMPNGKSYKIKSFPSVILFKDGYPYKDEKGRFAALSGFKSKKSGVEESKISVSELRGFIDHNFSDFIAKNSYDHEKIRKRRLQDSLTRYYWYGPSYGYGWGWGYPYGGWGYGGWGWRRGCW